MYLRLVVLEFDFLIFVSGVTRGCEEVSQPCLGDMGLIFTVVRNYVSRSQPRFVLFRIAPWPYKREPYLKN